MSHRTPTLLIVDDSRTSRTLIRSMTTKMRPAWRITEASNADEALRLIEAEPPDFVSLDVNMPGISGLEAAGRIRLKYPQTRVSLCTANIQESMREAAKKAGIHFVSKPVTVDAISDAIAFFES